MAHKWFSIITEFLFFKTIEVYNISSWIIDLNLGKYAKRSFIREQFIVLNCIPGQTRGQLGENSQFMRYFSPSFSAAAGKTSEHSIETNCVFTISWKMMHESQISMLKILHSPKGIEEIFGTRRRLILQDFYAALDINVTGLNKCSHRMHMVI